MTTSPKLDHRLIGERDTYLLTYEQGVIEGWRKPTPGAGFVGGVEVHSLAQRPGATAGRCALVPGTCHHDGSSRGYLDIADLFENPSAMADALAEWAPRGWGE